VHGGVVFDLDKVLLGGDATTLFLHGRLRRSPRRLAPLLLAAPLLVPGPPFRSCGRWPRGR
jgi:phosphatidylglycerophosphatase C